MSVFDDNITTPSPLEKFHDLLKRWYTDNFELLFIQNGGNIIETEKACQRALSGVIYRFNKFNMYHPEVIVNYVVYENCFSRISLSIIYSESQEDFLPSPDNVFLCLKLPVPSL
jgi:hypothetical protein